MNNPERISPWMNFFISVLDTNMGDEYETATENTQQIEALNKTVCWKLKGVVA